MSAVGRGRFKRFYETVAVEACQSQGRSPGQGGGYRVVLDGRPVKTPAKVTLVLPNSALAKAVAEEWARQGDLVDPGSMALTALSWAAVDRAGGGRDRVVDEIIAYGRHDLLCYRAEAPPDLVARQQALWQPLLDWAASALDAPLAVTSGIVACPQPPDSLVALRRVVADKSDMTLSALRAAVAAAGSVIVGLALEAGRIDAKAAFETALLDELYQTESWGPDQEAAARRAAIKAELEAAARFLALLEA